MGQTVFFSWQGDTASRVSRNLIEDALERALKALKAEAELDPADRELAVDRDRKGVPGQPPLMETIFAKIDAATAFVSDLTHVATRDDGRRMPNPNVLMEHGWALKAVTWRAMISVMNTAFGHPQDHPLPFDLQHFARPILFACPADATAESRTAVRDALAKRLQSALRDILKDQTLKASRRATATSPAEADPRESRLYEALQGLADDRHRGGVPDVVGQPSMTLRLGPIAAMDGSRLRPKSVAAAQQRFPPSVDVRVETGADVRQWWSVGLPRNTRGPNPETAWRMRLVRPGLLEYEASIGARIDDDPDIGIDGFRLEALIVRHLDRMASILTGLDLGGAGLAWVTLEGTEDVILTRPRGGGRRIRQPRVLLPAVRIADLDAPLGAELHETLDMIWLSSGWADGSPSYQGGDWAGYAGGAPYRID